MNLREPKSFSWWLAVILAALGILIRQGIVSIVFLPGSYDFWLVVIAVGLLLLATRLKFL